MVNTTMHNLGRYFILIVLNMLSISFSYADSLDAEVDRTQISGDENLQLTVRYSGSRVNTDPDFSALTQNFDVQSNGKSMKHSIVNGSVTSSTEWQFRLWPKKSGQLLIPPFTLNNVSSKAMRVTVANAASNTPANASNKQAGNNRPVFVEAEVNKQSAFVQEQILLTFRIFYRERFSYDNGGDLVFENTQTEALPNTEYQKTVNGAVLNVLEFRYAVFPDTSGNLLIPERLWTFETNPASRSRFGGRGGRQQRFRQKTPALTVEVKPKDDAFPTKASWMPATAVTLEESWSKATSDFTVGEPITRTVTLKARGQTAEQLPVTFQPQNDTQFKYYPDKPALQSDQRADGIIGMRQDVVAVVPSQVGELVLPAIEIPWWNVETNSVQIARVPARTIVVKPSANNSATPGQQDAMPQAILPPSANNALEASSNPLWFWVSVLSLVLNLFLLAVLFWLWRRATTKRTESDIPTLEPTTEHLLKRLETQCKQSNASAVRETLLGLAAKLSPRQTPTLSSLATQSNDPHYAQALMALDAVLFAGQSGAVDYTCILEVTRVLIERNSNSSQTGAELAPLYATP